MQAVDLRRSGTLRFLLGLLIVATPLWTWPAVEARSPVPAAVAAALDAPHVPGEIIVRFRDDISEEERRQALLDGGADESKAFDEINAKLAVTAPEDMAYVLAELELDPRVEYAEPNYLLSLDVIPSDPEFGFQWALNNEGQVTSDVQGFVDADIDAPEAWEITTGSPDVIVAVIDSGIDFDHPDLGGSDLDDNPRMWTNPGETCQGCPTDGIDNDGNGYVDDWRGWDFTNEDGGPRDDNGHGTHVAGILGAQSNNAIGGAGITWNTRLMALKTFGPGGGGETELAVEAVLYAVEKGASVINASWGSIFPSLALADAIEYAGQQGTLFVAAGGNDGLNTDLVGHFPSALDIPGMISVGASTSRDELAEFSNYGIRTVDLAAPGASIYSTWSMAMIDRPYRYASGTSMAAPMVSGVAALIKSIHPNATPLGIKNLILNSVDPIPALEGLVSSGGRLNAHTAVSCQNEPQVWVDRPVPGFAAVPGEPVEVRVLASNCAVPDGVAVTAHAGEPIELTPQGNGIFLGTYIPSDAADLSITAEARIGDLVDTHSVPGEVVLNYQFQAVPLEWLDATTGTRIEYSGEDDFEVAVELPFAFTFYNREVTEAIIGENGVIGFAGTRATNPLNAEIPDVLAPNGFVAPYWENFDLEDGGEIWYETIGEAPNRRFVVSWIDVENRVQGSSTGVNPVPPNGATFQAVLEEATGDIIFQYLDVNFGLSTIDYGQGATIGVEHYSGTVGRQFSYNDPSLRDYEGSRGIRFTLKAPNQPEITTGALPSAPTGHPYLQQLEVTDGEPPYTWGMTEGELPPGLVLDTETGIIAGTPYMTGSYTFTIEVTDSTGAIGSQFFTIGVDQGYQIQDDTFSWVDPTDGGERLPFERDDEAATVSLPFSFDYYGQNFDEVQVSTNGYIVFTEQRATRFTNTAMPDPREPNGVVAAFWDDISPQEQGGVWTRTVGEAPNRHFIVGWVDVPRFAAEATGSFEVILEEGTNDIIVQLLDIDFENERYDFGVSATVGIENLDGTVGAQFSYDEAIPEQYIGQTAIRFVANDPPEPVMNVETLPDGAVDTPFLSLLSAHGGAPPYTWSVAGGNLPPGLEIDPDTGVISGSPSLAGEFTFTAQATDSNDPAISTTAEYTITVLPSYAIVEGPFEWIDAREGGQRIDFESDDDAARTVSLPFSFNFYGEEYGEFWISSKGYITLGGSRRQTLINEPVPHPEEPNGLVAALWDDMRPDDGQGVWVRVVGEAPNRRAVISWIDASRFNEIGASTFQIILEEGTNRIILQYQDVVFEDERYDFGASATIGVEAPNGTIGTQFSFDQPALVDYQGTTAIIFEQVREVE